MTGSARDPVQCTELAALLRAGFAAGRETYPSLQLDPQQYESRVLRVSKEDSGAPAPDETLRQLALADLYLAVCCEQDVAGAWKVLVERFVPRLQRLARSLGATESDAEELARALPGDLFQPAGRGGTRSKLGTYRGKCSLFAWMAVLLRRRVVDRYRQRRAGQDVEAGPPRAASNETGPAEILIDRESDEKLRQSLAHAWEQLTSRERLALAFRYRDGLAQNHIARLMGVGEPRVSRLLTTATDRMRGILQRTWDGSPSSDRDWKQTCSILQQFFAERRQVCSSLSDNPADHPSPGSDA